MLNEDYKDMLQALVEEKAKFLLVGAYALAAHGYLRATLDIDIWVMPSPRNLDRGFGARRWWRGRGSSSGGYAGAGGGASPQSYRAIPGAGAGAVGATWHCSARLSRRGL